MPGPEYLSPGWKFDEPRVRTLILQWQIDGQGESEILSACIPLVTFVVRKRRIQVYGYEPVELVHEVLSQLPPKLRRYRSQSQPGTLFSFLSLLSYRCLLSLIEREARDNFCQSENGYLVNAYLQDRRPDPCRRLMQMEDLQNEISRLNGANDGFVDRRTSLYRRTKTSQLPPRWYGKIARAFR